MNHYRTIADLLIKVPMWANEDELLGLLFKPTIEPWYSDQANIPPFEHPNIVPAVTKNDLKVVRNLIKELYPRLRSILHIGINTFDKNSYSHILINERPSNCYYFGLDWIPRPEIHNPQKKQYAFTYAGSTRESTSELIYNFGFDSVDLIFIDGIESIIGSVHDFGYHTLMSDHGAMVITKTNMHPGPIAICETVDKNLYNVRRYCTGNNDYGLAVLRRKIINDPKLADIWCRSMNDTSHSAKKQHP